MRSPNAPSSRPRSTRWQPGSQDGAAVVEYVLVATLLVLVFLAVGQAALLLDARDTLVADAAEGARTAALRGNDLADGEAECSALAAAALAGGGSCAAHVQPASGATPPLIVMTISATPRLSLVPGGRIRLVVSAQAVQEPAQ